MLLFLYIACFLQEYSGDKAKIQSISFFSISISSADKKELGVHLQKIFLALVVDGFHGIIIRRLLNICCILCVTDS
jgi:hypothetical protein